jgi:hypothetical protein
MVLSWSSGIKTYRSTSTDGATILCMIILRQYGYSVPVDIATCIMYIMHFASNIMYTSTVFTSFGRMPFNFQIISVSARYVNGRI